MMGRILTASGVALMLFGLIVRDLGFFMLGIGLMLFVLSSPWHEEIKAKVRKMLNISE